MKVHLFSVTFFEYMIELANALSMEHEVILSLPKNRVSSKHLSLINDKIKFEGFDLVDYSSVRDNFKMLKSISSIISKHNPDIIHIQAHGFNKFWCLLVLMKRRRLVNTIHDAIPHSGDRLTKPNRWNTYIVNRFSNSIIVHGESIKSEVICHHGIDASKIYIVPHGHLGLFKSWSSKEYKREPNTFLFFGRIWPYKGLNYFIEAANKLAKTNENVRFIIAGKGEDINKYTNKIEQNSLFEIRNYRIPEEEVDELFQKVNCTVLPYTDATQSGVIHIAFAYRTFVIVSNVGSLPETVQNNKTGLLSEPSNSESVCEKMQWCVDNPSKVAEMTKNAEELLSGKLSWKEIATATIKIYDVN